MTLHLFFLFIYIALGSSFPPSTILMIAILQAVLAIYARIKDGSTYIAPYVIALTLSITNNIGNISLIDRLENNFDIMYVFTVPEYIPEAVTIWCAGCSIFFMGYLFFEKRGLPSVAIDIKESQINAVFYTMLTLLVFSQSIFQWILFLGNISKVIGLLASVGVLFFAKLWGAKGDKKYRNYAFILLLIQTYNAVFHSYLRFEIVIPSVVFSIGYFAGKKSIKYALSYRILPLILLLVLFVNIFSQLGAYRSNFATGIQNIYFNSDDEADEESLDIYATSVDKGGMFDRASTIGQISAVLKLVNTNGFYGGAASQPLVAALIPRFLWPDKPQIAIGQWFAIETGTAFIKEGDTKANNSINMTIPGELYLDFGWLGLLIGCFLFGGFIVILWNSSQFYLSDYNLTGAIWGGYLLYNSIAGVSGDLQIAITVLSFYIIFYIIKKIYATTLRRPALAGK